MSGPTLRLVRCSLLGAVLLGCGVAGAVDKAHDDPYGKSAGGVALTPDLEIGSPVHYAGVTLYPVIDQRAAKAPEGGFMTLREALGTRDFRISEVTGGGTVANLVAHNTGKTAVFLQAGDVVTGGNQDRIIAEDVIIRPSPLAQHVRVNCVEQDRWDSGDRAFRYGGRAEVALRRVLELERDQGATWAAVAQLNDAKAEALAAAGHTDAAFWLSPSSGTYAAALDAKVLEAKADKYIGQMMPQLAKQRDVVGVVVAVGSRIVASDLYGHPALFAKVSEEAVRSYVLDAITHRAAQRTYIPPSTDEAAWFLRDALASVELSERRGVGGSVRELDGTSTRSFVFHGGDGSLMHMSTYAE